MSTQTTNARAAGVTEHNWSQAVLGGTGIAVLAILTTKTPDASRLRAALQSLQISHPILRSKLRYSPKCSTYSFVTSPSPFIELRKFDLQKTRSIFEKVDPCGNNTISPFHLILEHEINENAWSSRASEDVLFASYYTLTEGKWVLVMRLHVAACDRTTAASLLRELLELIGDGGGGRGCTTVLGSNKGEVTAAIEDLIPNGKAKKTLWARGVDMLGYSVNSLRLTNFKFKDVKLPRSSQVVRLTMDVDGTQRILSGCKLRGIKLCGALTAAGVIALQNLESRSDHIHRKKYGIVTLTDCRSILEPPLSDHNFGFYHSAILNSHSIKTGEKLWDLAKKMYAAFASYKSCGRHFSDMADLNFLMLKAMDNPSLTSSSSLRSCFMTVFEDTAIDDSGDIKRELGVEDYIGCASVHGIGPSIGIFDTVRDGRLDCVCVYPSPLHSREQMVELVDGMKRVLVESE